MDEVTCLIAEYGQRFGDSPLPQLQWHVSGFEQTELSGIAVNAGVYRIEPWDVDRPLYASPLPKNIHAK